MSRRFYFHGDLENGVSGQYYCSFCDLFVNRDHFEAVSHRGSHVERFLEDKKNWLALGKKDKARYVRQADAQNLFAHLPRPKKKSSAFYRWLTRQKTRVDPIGDLSREGSSDTDFPRSTDSLTVLLDYLHEQDACSEAIQALVEAHREFKDSTKGQRSLLPSLRFDVLSRDNYQCRLCGATAAEKRLEVDHQVPVAKGGSDDEGNLWTLCFDCNRGKGTKRL